MTLLRAFLLMAGLMPCLLYSQPAITITGGTEFTFGAIATAAPVERLLTLRSTGTDTLVIEDVIALCGCTGTLLSEDHIAPGDSGLLSISFNPSTFSGHIAKSVHLRTNDPAAAEITINFTAEVGKALEYDPAYVFVKTLVDSITTATITLSNVGDKPVRLRSVRSTSDLVTVSTSDTEIEPGKEAMITTSFTSKLAGTFTGNIEIATDHALQPRLSIRYRAWVKAPPHPASTPQH
jgi:hypothetical protein